MQVVTGFVCRKDQNTPNTYKLEKISFPTPMILPCGSKRWKKTKASEPTYLSLTASRRCGLILWGDTVSPYPKGRKGTGD